MNAITFRFFSLIYGSAFYSASIYRSCTGYIYGIVVCRLAIPGSTSRHHSFIKVGYTIVISDYLAIAFDIYGVADSISCMC